MVAALASMLPFPQEIVICAGSVGKRFVKS